MSQYGTELWRITHLQQGVERRAFHAQCVSQCLSVCLPACLTIAGLPFTVCLSAVCLSACRSAYICMIRRLSDSPSVCLSACPHACPHSCLSVGRSQSVSVSVSVCLSVFIAFTQ